MQKSVKQIIKSSPASGISSPSQRTAPQLPQAQLLIFFTVGKSDALSLLGRGRGCWQMGAHCHLLPSLPTAPTHSGRTGLGDKPRANPSWRASPEIGEAQPKISSKYQKNVWGWKASGSCSGVRCLGGLLTRGGCGLIRSTACTMNCEHIAPGTARRIFWQSLVLQCYRGHQTHLLGTKGGTPHFPRASVAPK